LLAELFFHLDRLSDLCHLSLDEDRVTISFGMVLDKNIECFLVSVLRDKPSWGFWKEARSTISVIGHPVKTQPLTRRCRSGGEMGRSEEEKECAIPIGFGYQQT